MQTSGELHNIIQYIKWYYSGQTVQEIRKLHEKNISNFWAPTERTIKFWIFLFETKGCVNVTHDSESKIDEKEIDNVPDLFEISCNLNFNQTGTKLDDEVPFSRSNWEENNDSNAKIDSKEGILQIDLSKVKSEDNAENLNSLSNLNKEFKIEPAMLNKPSTSYKTNKRRRYCCLFCNKCIFNFNQHLLQRHSKELKVQQAFSLPACSSERKIALNVLRNHEKEAAFNNYRKGKINNCQPCPFCLRYYSFDTIKWHRIRCQNNLSNGKIQISNLKIDSELKNAVFPHMRIDYATMVAQNDLLICDFASNYYHGDKMNIPSTSCKMRQLAKFVVELRSRNSQFQNLIDILKPTNYDLLVAAIWKLAKFDWEKNRFNSPNFAISVGSSLKKCCQIAMQNPEKYDSSSSTSVQDLKDLLKEFETKWKQDVWDAALNSFSGNKSERKIINLTDQLKNVQSSKVNVSLLTRLKRSNRREPWTNEQKNIVTEYFRNHILQKQLPKFSECQFLKSKHPELLGNKKWQNIKSFVQYKYSYVTKNNREVKNDKI